MESFIIRVIVETQDAFARRRHGWRVQATAPADNEYYERAGDWRSDPTEEPARACDSPATVVEVSASLVESIDSAEEIAKMTSWDLMDALAYGDPMSSDTVKYALALNARLQSGSQCDLTIHRRSGRVIVECVEGIGLATRPIHLDL